MFFSRLFDVIAASILLVLVVSAGWLQTPKDRLGGIACVVVALIIYANAFRRRRRRSP